MAGRLNGFLDRAFQTPFAWGKFDCILFLADWSGEIGAGDPAAAHRGRYSGEIGARRIIRRAGTLESLVGLNFEPLGWTRTEVSRSGAVARVQAVNEAGPLQVGALRAGDRWAVLAKTGLLFADFTPLAIWEHPWLWR